MDHGGIDLGLSRIYAEPCISYREAVSTQPAAGLELTDCEIMTWAEVGRLNDWATQALRDYFLIFSKNEWWLRAII